MEVRILLPAPRLDDEAFPRQEEAVDLYLVFAPHRGRPIGFLGNAMPEGIEAISDASLPLNVVALRAAPNALREAADEPLSLTTTPEALQLVHVVIARKDPPVEEAATRVVLAAPEDVCGRTGRFRFSSQPGQPDDYFLHARKYLAAMDRAIGQDARRRFFFELDKETNENLIRETLGLYAPFRKAQIVELLKELEERARLRRQRRQSGGDPVLGPVTPARRPALEEISLIQLDALEQNFGITDWENQDLAPIFEAIGLFATGNLRLPLNEVSNGAWSCQPSSGYFLFFGEFALLASESETDRVRKRAWERLTPAYIAMQLPFHEVYGPRSRRRPQPGDLFASHSACNFDQVRSERWKGSRRRSNRIAGLPSNFPDLCSRASDDVARLWFRDP
jgi:hypothetical protein